MSALTHRERSVITLIEAAARLGEPCPTNGKLALALGVSIGKASEAVTELDRRGYLIVERFTNARRVTVVDSGLTTARPDTTARWRTRDTRARRQGDDVPIQGGARGAPCGHCGCRPDACSCPVFVETRLPSSAASSIVGASASPGGSRHAMGTHG